MTHSISNVIFYLDTLGSTTEFHVLDVAKCGVNVLNCEEVFINFMHFLKIHVRFFKVGKCEVEQSTFV